MTIRGRARRGADWGRTHETYANDPDIIAALLALLSITGAARAADDAVPLQIMIFNVWLGGDQVNIGAHAGRDPRRRSRYRAAAGAGGEDARDSPTALGYAHASERWHMVSRYPMFDPPAADADYALVEIRPGRFVAVSNIHLTSDPYGPYAVRDGKSGGGGADDRRRRRGCRRSRSISISCRRWRPSGIPVFIGGDFNAPSRLDWTEAMVGKRPALRYALDWPVSKALADAGFRDSYREIHPDPVANPGITWTTGYPVPHLMPDEAVDRIDQIYALGNSTTTASQIVGETGGPDFDIGIDALAVGSSRGGLDLHGRARGRRRRWCPSRSAA